MQAATYLQAQTVAAAAALIGDRFVTHTGAVPNANARVLGVALYSAAAAGDLIAVATAGTAIVEAGGVVAKGAAVATDAQGRAVAHSTGTVAGSALSAAAAAGDKIEVLLIAN